MSDDFKRKDAHKTGRIDDSYRKPRGSDNNQRLGKRGHPPKVDTGYRGPKEQRHQWDGKDVVTVASTDEIDDLNPDDEAARIPSMGRRKKTPLVQHAVDNGVSVVNLDEDEYIQQTEDFLEAREERQQRREEQEAQAARESEDDEDLADDDNGEGSETEDDDQDNESNTEKTADEATDDSEAIDASDAPTSDNTVKEIKAWLDDQGIEYKSKMLKADLLDLVNEHTEGDTE